MALPANVKGTDVMNAINSLKRFFDNTYEIGEKSITFHAKIGAYYTESMRIKNLHEVNEVLKRVAFCKYQVSIQNNSNIYIYTKNAYEEYQQKQLRIKYLPHILEHGEANLVFQPIINLYTGETVLYEVLLRVSNDMYQSTADFIDDCVSEGYDVALDDMVLSKLIDLVNRGLNTNLSVNLLGNTPITDRIKQLSAILLQNGKMLYLEITEHMINKIEATKFKAEQIKRCGAGIVADDYGIGYSNNSMVASIAFDIIKIPRELISGITTDTRLEYMVRSIAAYCKALGIICVAEGIETEEEFLKARELNVTCGQGYYLQRPMPAVPPVDPVYSFLKRKDPGHADENVIDFDDEKDRNTDRAVKQAARRRQESHMSDDENNDKMLNRLWSKIRNAF